MFWGYYYSIQVIYSHLGCLMEIDAVSGAVKRVPRVLLVIMKRVAAQQRRGVCRGHIGSSRRHGER